VENQIRIRIAARGGALRHSRSLRDGKRTTVPSPCLLLSLSLPIFSMSSIYFSFSCKEELSTFNHSAVCTESTAAVMPPPVNKAIILLGL
jgi:hypothetical protein